MAKILQCASCHSTMDVTDVAPGSTVACPECGQNSRIPSGNTSMRTKTVSPPIPAEPQRPASSGQLRAGSSPRLPRAGNRSRSGTMPAAQPQAKSQGGLFVGLGIGALGIVIVIIVFTMKEPPAEEPRAKAPVEKKGPSTVTFNPTLPAGSDKPIKIGEGGNKEEPKATTALSKPAETAENANWGQLMQQLRPAGGFDHLDRPEGVAFQKVKSFGPAAYPKLIAFIDDEDTAMGVAAVAVLNALTGRDEPLPKGVNKGKIKAEWEAWLQTAKPADPKK